MPVYSGASRAMRQTRNSVKSSPVRGFACLAEGYLAEMHELFPQEASELGLVQYEDKLGENGPETHRRHVALMERTLAEVERLPEGAFAGDDWLDRRGFLSCWVSGCSSARGLRAVENGSTRPARYEVVGCILDLVIRYAEDLQGATSARLCIPGFLAEGAECVRLPVPLWTRLARKTCQGAGSFLDEIEKRLTPLSAKPERTAGLFSALRGAFAKSCGRRVPRKSRGRRGALPWGAQTWRCWCGSGWGSCGPSRRSRRRVGC